MNRLETKFAQLKAEKQKGLITYVTAGDPNLAVTRQLVGAMAKAGADVVELGVPFSDPVADGPIIQQAAQRALQSGTTLAAILEMVRELRRETDIPLVLMTYVNPILHYGVKRFMILAEEVGVDGIIVPDLPLEEMELVRPMALAHNISVIPLVAPTSTEERIQRAGELASGFIYCVSLTGVTGIRTQVSNNIEEFTRQVRQFSQKPIALGFGIANPAQAARMAPYCDAVIVGSAIMQLIDADKPISHKIKEVIKLVSSLKDAANGKLEEDQNETV